MTQCSPGSEPSQMQIMLDHLLQLANDEGAAQIHDAALEISRLIGFERRQEYLRGYAIGFHDGGVGTPAQAALPKLPPVHEIKALIQDFETPDDDTERAFASHRRKWILWCLEACLSLGAQPQAAAVTDDELFDLAAAAWETQTIAPWYTDALAAVISAVRERLESSQALSIAQPQGAQDTGGQDLIEGGITAWIESQPTDAEIRNGIIEECAHAAFEAYGSLTSSQYVMEGPAGLAKRMINAIKSLTRPEQG